MPCQLAILGTGELQEYLQRLAKELGVSDDVYFPGWQKNPFKFMARADVFVLPSLSEGFGLALIEAMACRLPVIATDCPGGSREIIAPGNGLECGILVPVGDGKMYSGFEPCTPAELNLAGAILRLLQDSDLRQRYIGAGSARLRDFDREKFVESYRRVIGSAAP
jgi:glycosyltransferase involved in cell wall biosynthesis